MPLSADELPDHEYIIAEAKKAKDEFTARAWMLTAKTLFPINFRVQFEAYMMEKAAGRVAESAECFGVLLDSPHAPKQLWAEIEAIATALKDDGGGGGFLTRMFERMSPEMQHKILLSSAERSEDTMEHCRILLLLLKRFPKAVSTHGGPLVETLLSAEKHSSENCYARLLVVDTIPLLELPQSPRLLIRLLVRAIDFYNTHVGDGEDDIAEPWRKLFGVLELAGRQLGWDGYLITYSNSLNRDAYFQKLSPYRNSEDCRQLIYCGTVHLLRALHELNAKRNDQILLEAFADPESPPSKRRKGDAVEVTGKAAGVFLVAANCWDLLQSDEILSREFNKLTNQLQTKPWIGTFLEEVALYKGSFEKAAPSPADNKLGSSLSRASLCYSRGQYRACLEHVTAAFSRLPLVEGQLESSLTIGGHRRHVHFLPLTKSAIVHYCAKLLLHSIKSAGEVTDLAAGNTMVLLQLDWPRERPLFKRLIEAIKQRGAFQYPPFQAYVVNVNILEELTHVWSEASGNFVLDILPNAQQHLGQRRIGTRGADKGVKEDIRHALKAQVARSNESILDLVVQFVTEERGPILQSFVSL